MRQIGLLMLIATAAVTLWQIAILGPKLPDPVASHFNASGVATGWSGRGEFLWLHASLQCGLAAFFVGIVKGSKWIPDSLWNLPHKEYWLHPDRRHATLQKTGASLILIAGMTGVFLAVIFQFVYMANIQQDNQLPAETALVPLAVYLTAIGIIVGKMMWELRWPDIGRNAEDE